MKIALNVTVNKRKIRTRSAETHMTDLIRVGSKLRELVPAARRESG